MGRIALWGFLSYGGAVLVMGFLSIWWNLPEDVRDGVFAAALLVGLALGTLMSDVRLPPSWLARMERRQAYFTSHTGLRFLVWWAGSALLLPLVGTLNGASYVSGLQSAVVFGALGAAMMHAASVRRDRRQRAD